LGWWHSQYDGKNKIHVPNHERELELVVIFNHNLGATLNTFLTAALLGCFDALWQSFWFVEYAW
jgi:hypothetical protein